MWLQNTNTSDYIVFRDGNVVGYLFPDLSVELRLRYVYQKINRYDDAVTYVATHQRRRVQGIREVIFKSYQKMHPYSQGRQ